MLQSGTYYFINFSLSSSNAQNMRKHEMEILNRIVELYEMLYLEKYSKINPQFTSLFVLNCLLNKTITIKLLVNGSSPISTGTKLGHGHDNNDIFVLKNISTIHGVIGFWNRGGILTTPLLGYDMKLPQKVGIYRLLSLEIMKTGREKNLLVNASGGVGDFKRKRGAQTFIEFNGVYSNKHISFVRKLPWMVLTWLTNCGMWYIKGRKDI